MFFIFIYNKFLKLNIMSEQVNEFGTLIINGNSFNTKDISARELIHEIIGAITLNNSAIGSRINDLNDRLSEVESNYVNKSVIGNMPIKTEAQPAVYYTQEEANAYNTEHSLSPGDDGYVTTNTIKIPATEAIPYTVAELITENERIVAFSLTDLNTKLNNISLTPGPQGETGAQGDAGVQGNQGAIGETGAQGNQGTIGNAGAQGNQGVIGEIGAQGNQGTIGETGPQGNQGAIGETGAQGNQGAIGETGPQGAQGNDSSSNITIV